MKDLHEMLLNVNDSYDDFVAGMERRCKEDSDIKNAVVDAINKNKDISTDDILELYSSIHFKKMGFDIN